MTHLRKRILPTAVAAALLCLPVASYTLVAQTSTQTQPDNSAQNKTQNKSGTADNNIDPKADRETTAKIRKAIIADKDLSTYAHNVKILVKGGQVTLKGPVKSDDEKQKVAADAASVVDAGSITNSLTVKQQ